MPILLFSDNAACAATLPALLDRGDGLRVILTQGESALAATLGAALPDLAVVEAGSPRFARLNFDALALAVVDLAPEFLDSTGGRRLLEALGRLAEEGLALAFVGEAAALTGAILLDGVRAGLRLLPGTAVIPALAAVGDLRALLARLGAQGARLLALDAPVGLRYDAAADRVTVRGAGSVLLAAFHPAAEGTEGADAPAPVMQTARLHVLTDGLAAGWPEKQVNGEW